MKAHQVEKRQAALDRFDKAKSAWTSATVAVFRGDSSRQAKKAVAEALRELNAARRALGTASLQISAG